MAIGAPHTVGVRDEWAMVIETLVLVARAAAGGPGDGPCRVWFHAGGVIGNGDTEQRWRALLESVALNLALAWDGEPVGMVSATAPDAHRADGEQSAAAVVLSVKPINEHAIALYRATDSSTPALHPMAPTSG